MRKLVNTEFKELSPNELKRVNGGWWQFAAGAIVGGILYDCWKAGLKWTLEGNMQEPMLGGR